MAITFKSVTQASANAAIVSTPSLGSASVGDLALVAVAYNLAGGTGTSISDNAGNTYSVVTSGGRFDGFAGIALYQSILTISNGALSIIADERGTSGANGITAVGLLISGVNAYNSDGVNNADFSGSSTAWSVGPTSPAPAAGSLFICAGSVSATQSSIPDPTGYNTVGSNGFTSGMETNMKQLSIGSSSVPIFVGYKISSVVETPALTLVTAANWFGVVGSFSPVTSGATIVERRTKGMIGRVGTRRAA